MTMRLHLLSVPHTVTTKDFAHCAFTQKVYKLSRMMVQRGYEVVHYGVEGSDAGATTDVVLMSQAEHQRLLGHPYRHDVMYGTDALDGNDVYRQWNLYARDELKARVQAGDLILLPFGHAHAAAVRNLPNLKQGAGAVESGVGYFDCLLPWRIYESEAGRHACMGRENRAGVHIASYRLEFVVPNYYDTSEWPLGAGGDSVVFLGRLTEGKGIGLILDLARARPDVHFRIAGQGDIAPFGDVPPNVELVGPLTTERAAYLGNARAIIAPSFYIEPFCGSVVEAALCGTPAITSHFGAFTETIEHGVTGYRCQTVDQYLAAIDNVTALDRTYIRERAVKLYAMERVAKQYDEAFQVMRQHLQRHPYPVEHWNT